MNIYPIKHVIQDILKLDNNFKTKEIDSLIKFYIKSNYSIEYNYDLLKKDVFSQRVFFFVNLSYIKSYKEKYLYIDKYKHLFNNWWHTDQLIKQVNKTDFDLMFNYASKYINNSKEYIRRWGYVEFIFHPCKKDFDSCKKIIKLLKNDNSETVMMAEAWLICELAIFHTEYIYNLLKEKKLSYKITSKSISKICDSFRIKEEWKKKFESIRKDFY